MFKFNSPSNVLPSAAAAVSLPVAQGLSDGLSEVRSTNRAAAPGNLGDNTRFGARNLGVLSNVRQVNDFVGSTDTQDYYRFTLSGTRLNVTLTGLSADADLRVYNASGAQIGVSNRSGSQDDALHLSGLTNGATYYVRVNRFSGNTNYTLRLSNSRPNELLSNETSVGNLSGTRNFSGSVNNSDTSNLYRFNLSTTSNVTARLTGVSRFADADLRIIRDANSNGIVDAGEEIVRSAAGLGASENINLQGLGAGSYIAQVYQYDGSTSYTLQLSGSAGRGFASEPNNTVSQAYNIGTLNGSRQFGGFVGTSDVNDYYRFSIGGTRTFNLSLSGLSQDADVQLLSRSGAFIASSTRGGTSVDSISRTLSAGDYVVRVFRFSSANTNYSLNFSA